LEVVPKLFVLFVGRESESWLVDGKETGRLGYLYIGFAKASKFSEARDVKVCQTTEKDEQASVSVPSHLMSVGSFGFWIR
jgi:hypothetical protein